MLTIEEIRTKLQPYNLRAVAGQTGLPYSILWRSVRKGNTAIKYEVVKTLSDFLLEKHTA
jgi:hypothetical protein